MLNLRDAVRDSSNWNRFVLTQFLHDTLPKDLFSLTELEILHITFTYLERIPEEMCALTNLSILALARNKLRNIDNIVCLQNLRSLDLLGNKLTSIPENFEDLDRLEYLDLSNNNFAAGLKGSLPESLVEIRLVNCNIQSFPQELLSLNTIRTVYLANNPELKTIPASIQNLTEMEELVLSGTGLSSDQIQDLRRMLPNCQIFFEPAR